MEREDLDPLRLFVADAARRPLLEPAERVSGLPTRAPRQMEHAPAA